MNMGMGKKELLRSLPAALWRLTIDSPVNPGFGIVAKKRPDIRTLLTKGYQARWGPT